MLPAEMSKYFRFPKNGLFIYASPSANFASRGAN